MAKTDAAKLIAALEKYLHKRALDKVQLYGPLVPTQY